MKRSCAVHVILAFVSVAFVTPCCHDASHAAALYLVRGGGGTSSRWSSSSQTRIIVQPRQEQSQQQQQQQRRYPKVEDIDDATTKDIIDAFLTRDSRNSFIARVYAILSAQMLFTALIITLFGLNPGLCMWIQQAGSFVPLVSLGLATIAWFGVNTSVRARREAPVKWLLLSLFTLGEAVSVGFISSFYTFQSVVRAMLATTLATTGVSLYTILQNNPKYDLSSWGQGLASAGVIFFSYGLIHLLSTLGILPAGLLPFSEFAYSCLGASLFSFYLAYHTKLIVAGKHTKYRMNEKDYVLGAMCLYDDVINMFVYFLRLLGEDKED